MQTDVANGQTFDTVLMIASWLVLIFGTLWFVTGFLGWMHRRAYNLTRAESDGSSAVTPDFLKVDKKKRQAAIERGEAYDEVLEKRAAAAAAAANPTVEQVNKVSRAVALITASFTLVGAVISTLTRVDTMQEGVEQLSSWDSFVATIQKYPAGAVVAALVIGANIIIFVKATKKIPARG